MKGRNHIIIIIYKRTSQPTVTASGLGPKAAGRTGGCMREAGGGGGARAARLGDELRARSPPRGGGGGPRGGRGGGGGGRGGVDKIRGGL
jgi:ATP-dependent RNA helicase RhlE